MASFIAIPLKKTSEVDLVKPLKNLFSSYCISADEPVQYDSALTELNKLRMNSTWRTLDKHESSLDIMTKYYDQLNFLDAKCPAIDFPVSFKWKDAFDKGTFFTGSASLTIASLVYEKVCILFNIGAMQSQIAQGHVSDIRNDDGLKLAAKFFQQASGTFQHLKSMLINLQQDPTPDLQPDTLLALHTLMLAQAQESFLYKAITDNMKDAIIARVASQCEELYGEALKQLNKESTRVLWEKEWLMTLAGKQAGFQALAQYYQSLVCKASKDVGEEIARLEHSSELLKLAEVRGGPTFLSFKDYVTKVSYALSSAKKDNDFIYHARVPDIKSLSAVGKAILAKPAPIPEKLNPSSQDLFVELLPMVVQQAIQTFETRKMEVISEERAKIQSQTQLLNGILASLNLPAALEDTTGRSLPPSLREKADAVREKGGIEELQKKLDELPNLLQRNREIMNECEQMLTDEEEFDGKLRNQFKNQWTRTSSSKLNAPLKANIEKYNSTMTSAMKADNVVRQQFNEYREKMFLLSLPEDELVSQIPSGSPTAHASSAAEELRRLMEQVKQLLNERNHLKEEVEGTTTDMKAKFMSALSMDGSVNEQAMSVETIGEVYGPIQKKIRDNLNRQEQLVENITRVNTDFCSEKQGVTGRESMLKDLAAAHDVYMEISGNLEEGTGFYNSLTQILVQFQNKISDFCFARKTEREELCKELQTSIVQDAAKTHQPTQPAHYNQNVKPTRPPPPNQTNIVPQQPSTAPQSAPYAYPGPVPVNAASENMTPYPVQQVFPYPYPTPAYFHQQYYPPAQPNPYTPTGYMNPPQQPQPPPQAPYQPGYPPQPYYHQYYPPQ